MRDEAMTPEKEEGWMAGVREGAKQRNSPDLWGKL